MKMAGMTKTEPPATMPEVAPDRQGYSRSSMRIVLRRALAENPTAKMLMGIAVSMPCPSLSAMVTPRPRR